MNQDKSGKFIAKLRKEKNMTQEQLAEKMGVSINAVSKWERGLSFPDVSLYKKICKELDINIEELINFKKKHEDANILFGSSIRDYNLAMMQTYFDYGKLDTNPGQEAGDTYQKNLENKIKVLQIKIN